jgi:hypothetical protein
MSKDHWALFCGVVLAVVCLTAPAHADVTYTFEGLSAGNLIGQDNWLHANTGAATGAEAQVQAGTGFDGTTVARSNTGNVQVRRGNDANFSIPTFTGTETIYLQADFLFNGDLNVFRIESDEANSNPFSSTPYFGFTGNLTTTAAFALRAGHNGASTNVLLSAVAPEIQAGDWVRMQMVLDMSANSGDGSASTYYQDLTLGQTGFTPIAGQQNIAAGLLANAGPGGKYYYDGMYFRGGVTNGGQQIDNLTVGVVPEPSAIALGAIGLAGMLGYGWRKRHSV